MSTLPDQLPEEPEDTGSNEPVEMPAPAPEPPAEWTGEPGGFAPVEIAVRGDRALELPVESVSQSQIPTYDPQFLVSYGQPLARPTPRIPHFGHLGLLFLLVCLGWLGAGALLLIALQFHLFGISTLGQAATDFRYNLGLQGIQYLLTFAGSLIIFPLIWHMRYFAGLHWNGATALRFSRRLVGASFLCFIVAMLNGWLIPGPPDAPIDHLFRMPGAAWLLFAFGVTVAPFFEEMAFRGFLLPALCTAYDWLGERSKGVPRRPLDGNGNPQWSMPAMIVGSILTSLPFALMHGEQTGYSLGPFLLLVFVSLVLCWVRLSMRSLAASTLVHSCYNLMLFSFMLLGTDGFKHLDKM
jgi:hypothetical protein